MIELVNDIVEKDGNTGEKFVIVKINNTSIKMIKSAVEFYKGDADDPKNIKNQEQLKEDIHQVWRVLNPS